MADKKIAVFLGDWFWSSIPYEGLNVFLELSKEFDCDLIAFEKDIRLNKTFEGYEKFFFDPDEYRNCKNLKTLSNWFDLRNISSDYSIMLAGSHLAPKTRWPFFSSTGRHGCAQGTRKKFKALKEEMKCKMGVWDIGGADILTDGIHFADVFFTKGEKWTNWLKKMGYQNAYTTGTPHYDYYLEGSSQLVGTPINKEAFIEKYGIDKGKRIILLLPSNPGSFRHNVQFRDNLKAVEDLINFDNVEVLIKTYPHDYVFNEKEAFGTGIYKRSAQTLDGQPAAQYELISAALPSVKVIESQDHFSAIMYSDAVFNLAGSHVAWETYLTDSYSYSMNYFNQPYFQKLSYLPEYIEFPDKQINHEMESIEEILEPAKIDKDGCQDFILKEMSIGNISKQLKKFLEGKDASV